MKTKNLLITIGCLFVLSFSTDLIRVYSKIRFSLNKNLDKLDKIQKFRTTPENILTLEHFG